MHQIQLEKMGKFDCENLSVEKLKTSLLFDQHLKNHSIVLFSFKK